MEGAKAFEVLAGPGQRYMLADNLRDVHPVPDLVNDVVRNQSLAHSGPHRPVSIQPPGSSVKNVFETIKNRPCSLTNGSRECQTDWAHAHHPGGQAIGLPPSTWR